MENMDTIMNITERAASKRFCKAALIIGLTGVLAFTGCGKEEKNESAASEPQKETQVLKNGQVMWQDKIYTYNDHLSNFLFLGIDKETLTETEIGSQEAGQSDALFLLSWDRVTGDVTLVTIPRDTMTEINVFGRDGTDLGPTKQHISFAYGYGDGKHESCKLAKEAVSRLFYRIPVQGYCAVSLEALEAMSRELGAVKVTVPNDSLESINPAFAKGTEAEITEENVEQFVRYRDITVDNSALYRSERQNAFLEACYEKLRENFSKDPGSVTDLYTALTPYMVTNIGNDQFFKIMEGVAGGGEIDRWTVAGEGVTTDLFDEYHVDEDAFYEQVLASFFEEES